MSALSVGFDVCTKTRSHQRQEIILGFRISIIKANLANSAKSLEIQGFSPRTDRRTAGELRQSVRWLWVDYEWILAVCELV